LGIVASFQYYISTTCGAVFSFSSKGWFNFLLS
jgi:hypothetical protein